MLEDGTIQAGDITVGQGSPRPVLQHPNKFPHGGRGTETPVLLLDTQPPHYTWRCYYKTGGPRPTFFLQKVVTICVLLKKK